MPLIVGRTGNIAIGYDNGTWLAAQTQRLLINGTVYINNGNLTINGSINLSSQTIPYITGMGNTKIDMGQAATNRITVTGSGGLYTASNTIGLSGGSPYSLDAYSSTTPSILSIKNSGTTSKGMLTVNIMGGTINTSSSNEILNITATWNGSGTPTAIKTNIQIINYSGDPKIFDMQINSTSLYTINYQGISNYTTNLQPIVLSNNATVWNDLQVPLVTAKLGATSKPDFDYTNIGYLFPQNDATEKLYIIAQLPHTYKEGSNICAHLHWDMNATQIPVWKLNYTWYNNGQNGTRTWTTLTTNSTTFTYTSGRVEQISNWTCITGTNMNISSIFKAVLWREDNLVTGDVLADSFDIHYEQDTLGSASEYNKWR